MGYLTKEKVDCCLNEQGRKIKSSLLLKTETKTKKDAKNDFVVKMMKCVDDVR